MFSRLLLSSHVHVCWQSEAKNPPPVTLNSQTAPHVSSRPSPPDLLDPRSLQILLLGFLLILLLV